MDCTVAAWGWGLWMILSVVHGVEELGRVGGQRHHDRRGLVYNDWFYVLSTLDLGLCHGWEQSRHF